MITYKTDSEIAAIRKSADLASRTMGEVSKYIRPGVTTNQLDNIASQYIISHGGIPTCKNYLNQGFPGSIATSVNDAVVHGMPTDYKLKEGDIITIDLVVNVGGFNADMAYTFPVGKISLDKQKLLDVTYNALHRGIQKAISGNRTSDIGTAIQDYVERNNYSVVRDYVGHGIGRSLHEEPEVPNYDTGSDGSRLQERMVICVEPMVNIGSNDIYLDPDGHTVRTKDGKDSAHFEHTVLVRKDEPEVLTTYKYIK